MRINLYQFQLLSRQAQIEVICNRGVYLSTHETSCFTIDRYKVDHFYVEVFYNQMNNEIILNSYYSVVVNDHSFVHEEEKKAS